MEKSISKIIIDELLNIINSHLRTFELWSEAKRFKFDLEFNLLLIKGNFGMFVRSVSLAP